MPNEKNDKTEKYEARSKMLERLIDQIFENQERSTNLKQEITHKKIGLTFKIYHYDKNIT